MPPLRLVRRCRHPGASRSGSCRRTRYRESVPAEDFQSLTGASASGRVKGKQCFIGSPALFAEKQITLADAEVRIEDLQTSGNSVVVIGAGQEVLGLIAIADPLRAETAEAIADLKWAGIHKVIMLTGGNPRTAQAIAVQAGIDEVFAEPKPADKIRKVKELDKQYGRVAMVGDGVNDAPALASAYVGIAVGAAGTDVALETADVALMADDLSRLSYLIRFSRRNWSVIRQNLALSATVIGSLVIGVVAGMFSLPVAVLAHEVSEFVVIASGLWMLRA